MKATTLMALPLIGLALGTAVGICRAETTAPNAAQAHVSDPSLDQALMDAAEKGGEEAVARLLAAGADVNAKDKSGATPLHEAARRGHTGAVRLLVEAGADVHAKNGRGATGLFQIC